MSAHHKNCLITVATASHLYWAKAWSDRVRITNPESDVLVFVLDSKRGALEGLPFAAGVQLMGVEDLPYPRLHQARRYFNPMEFCGLAKSFALEHTLFELGYANAIYLDSDTWSFGRLDEAWQALEKHAMALTPHIASPFPSDSQRPDELDVLRHGYINSGFWAARQDDTARRMLEWTKARGIHRGFALPSVGLFVDQNLISCLPWLFPESVGLLRHPGLNVAYWNLYERRLAAENDALTSNGKPLTFLHYSGFNPTKPEILTKYTSRPVTDENLRVLRPLMKEYAQTLQAAKSSLPPTVADFPCTQKHLWGRLRDYRQVYGSFPDFAASALLEQLAERLGRRWPARRPR